MRLSVSVDGTNIQSDDVRLPRIRRRQVNAWSSQRVVKSTRGQVNAWSSQRVVKSTRGQVNAWSSQRVVKSTRGQVNAWSSQRVVKSTRGQVNAWSSQRVVKSTRGQVNAWSSQRVVKSTRGQVNAWSSQRVVKSTRGQVNAWSSQRVVKSTRGQVNAWFCLFENTRLRVLSCHAGRWWHSINSSGASEREYVDEALHSTPVRCPRKTLTRKYFQTVFFRWSIHRWLQSLFRFLDDKNRPERGDRSCLCLVFNFEQWV